MGEKLLTWIEFCSILESWLLYFCETYSRAGKSWLELATLEYIVLLEVVVEKLLVLNLCGDDIEPFS